MPGKARTAHRYDRPAMPEATTVPPTVDAPAPDGDAPRPPAPPVTRLVLARHAVTAETGPQLTGRKPGVDLSEEGQRQATALADRLAGLPVALALSWRTAETGDGADRLARLEKVAADGVVSLTPLSQSGVRTLLTQEFGTVPADRFAAACHAVTGGNAFLLRELIQQLRADGIAPGEEVAAQVAALGPRARSRTPGSAASARRSG